MGALGQGPRDAPARQRTLTATLDWSYDLLNAEEKNLLGQLSIFQGGWTLEAMEAICGDEANAGSETPLFDGLQSLIDKSLVQTAENANDELGSEPRFNLLQTVRDYARARLPQEQATMLQRSHRDYFLQLAERSEVGLETPEAQTWYERLFLEEANLYAALDWCQKQPAEGPEGAPEGAELGLRLAGALWHYWHVRGVFREGRAWLALFLQRTPALPTHLRARALNGAGMLAYRQGDYAEVARLCGEALTISQALADQASAAFALHYLAHVAQERGSYGEAEEMLARSVSLYREAESQWGFAEALNCQGDLRRELRHYPEAVALFEQSLMLRRQLKDRRGIAVTLCNLGHALCRLKNAPRAMASFREAMEIAQTLHNQLMCVIGILGFAEIATLQGDPRRAAQLLGATTALLASFDYRLEPSDRAGYESLLAQVRGQLDEESFDAAWATGAQMTLTQALAFV